MISNELILFTKDFFRHRGELSPDTRLYEDLRIYGDDAEEFLVAFAENFNVDITQFRFDRYFYHETPFVLINPFKKKKETLYLRDLQKAIDCGYLT